MRRMEARRRKASALRERHSQSLARRRQRLSHPMVRSTVRCTTLPSASVGLIRPVRGGGRDAEDNLDVSLINLDASVHQAKDITLCSPVQKVEVLAHTSGEELQLANNQGQLALCFARSLDLLALLFQLRHPASQVGNARLELAPFDHALGITVDEPADPAP